MNREYSEQLGIYLRQIGKIRNLTHEEELKLGRERAEGSEEALEKLIKHNLKLVIHIAKRYWTREVPFLDLIEEGNIGLIKAAQKYDYRKGYHFSTYAAWWIKQALLRSINDQSRTIKIPRSWVEILKEYEKEREQLAKKGINLTIKEISKKMNCSYEKLTRCLMIDGVYSLDSCVGKDEDTNSFYKFIGDDKENITKGLDSVLLKKEIYSILNSNFKDRDVNILVDMFGLNGEKPCSLRTLEKKYGLGVEGIRQIKERAIRKLKVKPSVKRLACYLER